MCVELVGFHDHLNLHCINVSYQQRFIIRQPDHYFVCISLHTFHYFFLCNYQRLTTAQRSNIVSIVLFRVHAVIIKDLTTAQAYELVDSELTQIGLAGVKGKDIIDIIDGYVGGGYSVFTDQDISKTAAYNLMCLDDLLTEQLITISTSTGIVLDHTYTMKAVKGLLGELHSNPGRFKGKRILYVHTGMVLVFIT